MIYSKKKGTRKPCLIAAILAAFLLVNTAYAQTIGQDLVGLGLKPEIADYIANNVVSGGAVLSNNVYFSSRNAANSANISMLKVDANDETILNSDSGDGVHLQAQGDTQRVLNFTAANDTALVLTFGDGTSAQNLSILASSSDGSDSQYAQISGGGARDIARGGYLEVYGNESGGTGSAGITAGDVATAFLDLQIENASSSIRFKDYTTGVLWSITDAGVLTQNSSNGSNLIMSKAGTGAILGATVAVTGLTTAPLQVMTDASTYNAAVFQGYGTGASDAPTLVFAKTKGAASATNTIVANNDVLGMISFRGADGGSGYDPAAYIIVKVSGTPGASADMPASMDFQLSPDGSETPASVLKLDQDKSAIFSGALNFPTANEEAVAGAGTTVADAAQLSATKHVHQITGANGTVGWKFGTPVAGQLEILLNTTAGVPKIYAASGGTCNGGAADAACTLVTGIGPHLCWAASTTAWICS